MSAAKGVIVRPSTQAFRVEATFVSSSTNAPVTTGTATASVFEVEADGTLRAVDFSTSPPSVLATSTAVPTTGTVALTPQSCGGVAQPYWSATFAGGGLTVGGVYLVTFAPPSGASTPNPKLVQYGQVDGDLTCDTSGRTLLQPTQTGVTIPTVTAVTGLNTATIAAAVMSDVTDVVGADVVAIKAKTDLLPSWPTNFASLSITSGGAVAVASLGVGVVTASSVAASALNGKGDWPSAATIATAVLTDTTSGDLATPGSPGKTLSQLGGAFTTQASSIFSSQALVNAPAGGGGGGSVTVAGYATGQDPATLLSSSFAAIPAAAADKLLGRNLAGGADGGRTVRDSLRAARNKVAFDVPATGQFTVYAEDDATAAWTGTYTRGPNTTGPLTGVDPT